jgi:lysozyme family protein
MKENFVKYMPHLMVYEGTVFEEHPEDPGGPTKFGITIYNIGTREGVKYKDVKKNWTRLREIVKNLTIEEAYDIYKTKYWNVMKCDQLPSGIDVLICDHGINAGPSKSIRIAQQVLSITVDGKIGPKTLEALKKVDVKKFISDFSEGRRAYYKSRPHFKTFGRGWLNRVDKCEKFALSIV